VVSWRHTSEPKPSFGQLEVRETASGARIAATIPRLIEAGRAGGAGGGGMGLQGATHPARRDVRSDSAAHGHVV
jgi:hypothetical protein